MNKFDNLKQKSYTQGNSINLNYHEGFNQYI